MAFAPLVLKGNLKVNGTDFSELVTSFSFVGNRDTIDIPATFGKRKSYAAGGDMYEVTIEYLQEVATPSSLQQIFWDALNNTTGTVTIEGTPGSGAVSATNPKWTATAVVTSWEVGGQVNSVGTASITLPCTDRPVRAVA